MGIKIKLPEINVNSDEIEARIRATMKEDLLKSDGLLSKCFVFIKLHGPLSITDLCDKLQIYYKKEFERTYVYRSCDRLYKFGLIHKTMVGDILLIPEEEKTPTHRHIEAIHRKFLGNISPQFRNKYNIRNYVYFNEESEKFLEWACKINNFHYVEDEKKD